MSGCVEGVRGNREVSPDCIERAGMYGAPEAPLKDGVLGEHGFPAGASRR